MACNCTGLFMNLMVTYGYTLTIICFSTDISETRNDERQNEPITASEIVICSNKEQGNDN